MRFIDKSGCNSAFEKGMSINVKRTGKLTRTSTKIAEGLGLGVLKRRDGKFRIIRECGLGSKYDEYFDTLQEVDEFFKSL